MFLKKTNLFKSFKQLALFKKLVSRSNEQLQTPQANSNVTSKNELVNEPSNIDNDSIPKEQLVKIYKKSRVGDNVEYFENLTKHRAIYRLFDLSPVIGSCYIAPNATIAGEVELDNFVSIGYNCVIRGDINTVFIGKHVSIADHTVITTVNSVPSGIPAVMEIGEHCIIQSRCSLVSSILEDQVLIGHGSVILEGCRIETGSVVLPNSVVPPGRIIPTHQVWGGNPARYVRDMKPGEVFSNFANTYQLWEIGKEHLDTFTPYNYAYLDIENYAEDVDLTPDMVENFMGGTLNYKLRPLGSDEKYYLL